MTALMSFIDRFQDVTAYRLPKAIKRYLTSVDTSSAHAPFTISESATVMESMVRVAVLMVRIGVGLW